MASDTKFHLDVSRFRPVVIIAGRQASQNATEARMLIDHSP